MITTTYWSVRVKTGSTDAQWRYVVFPRCCCCGGCCCCCWLWRLQLTSYGRFRLHDNRLEIPPGVSLWIRTKTRNSKVTFGKSRVAAPHAENGLVRCVYYRPTSGAMPTADESNHSAAVRCYLCTINWTNLPYLNVIIDARITRKQRHSKFARSLS